MNAVRGLSGRLALALLPILALSGVVLAALYSVREPLGSLEAIDAGLPWAWTVRAVHGIGGLLLVVATAGHLLECAAFRDETRLPVRAWWGAVMLLPLVVAAMLSGFVLRGDAEAVSALGIWRAVLQSVPLLGHELATLGLGAPGDLSAVALHHVGTFTLAVWLLASQHGRRLFSDTRPLVAAALVVGVLACFFPVGLGTTPGPSGMHLGPWYLLGLQGMLLDLPVAFGWAAPLAFLTLLGLLRHVSGRARTGLAVAIAAFVAAYVGFTIRILVAAAGNG